MHDPEKSELRHSSHEADEQSRATGWLIHNDYKYDNVVLDPGDITKIIGVLDWEMCTIGDPLSDLGTTLGYWVDSADPEDLQINRSGPTAHPGSFTREELVELLRSKNGPRRFPDAFLPHTCPVQTRRHRAANLLSLPPRPDQRRALCLHAPANRNSFAFLLAQRAVRKNLKVEDLRGWRRTHAVLIRESSCHL